MESGHRQGIHWESVDDDRGSGGSSGALLFNLQGQPGDSSSGGDGGRGTGCLVLTQRGRTGRACLGVIYRRACVKERRQRLRHAIKPIHPLSFAQWLLLRVALSSPALSVHGRKLAHGDKEDSGQTAEAFDLGTVHSLIYSFTFVDRAGNEERRFAWSKEISEFGHAIVATTIR